MSQKVRLGAVPILWGLINFPKRYLTSQFMGASLVPEIRVHTKSNQRLRRYLVPNILPPGAVASVQCSIPIGLNRVHTIPHHTILYRVHTILHHIILYSVHTIPHHTILYRVHTIPHHTILYSPPTQRARPHKNCQLPSSERNFIPGGLRSCCYSATFSDK